jgi:hypothetical protein
MQVLRAILLDIRFIIESLEERALDSRDDDAKRILRSITNVKFLGLLSGMVNIYSVIAKLSSNLQKVNLFVWERQDFVCKAISSMNEMIHAFQSPNLFAVKRLWPIAHHYWPLLSNNTLLRDIPYLEQESV